LPTKQLAGDAARCGQFAARQCGKSRRRAGALCRSDFSEMGVRVVYRPTERLDLPSLSVLLSLHRRELTGVG
jgi:hypothetical protein